MIIYVLIFFVYNAGHIILFPFLLGCVLWYFYSRKNFASLPARFGFIPKSPSYRPITWIHAVSVGEILSIEYVIKHIKQKNPDTFCYITTGTITGKVMAEKFLSADCISYLPFDFLPSMLLAFSRIKPNKIIIIEAEIWPNLIMLARWKKIPLYLMNARISDRSYKRYRLLQFFFTPLFNSFTSIHTQSALDTDRFISLGVIARQITLLGNIKTLNVLKKKEETPTPIYLRDTLSLPGSTTGPILLVGSIHPGELDIYLEVYTKLKKNYKGLKLILAPRHFTWKQELVQKVTQSGYTHFLWEKSLTQPFNTLVATHDIILVCVLGELFNLYSMCDIFFLGGTFVPVGGHNLLEPAVWAKSCIIGPYNHNCIDIAQQLQKHHGLIIVQNKEQLFCTAQAWLQNPNTNKQVGQANYQWLVQQAHTIETQIKKIL